MKLKRIIAGAMCMMMIGNFTACGVTDGISGSADAQSASAVSSADGNWEVNGGSLDISENAAAKAAFEKAVEGLLGVEYEPLYLLGTQALEGTSYCVLAKTRVVYPDAKAAYALVYIHERPDGSAEINSIRSLADMVGVSEDERLMGGWRFNQGDISLDANKGAGRAFELAVSALDGAEYDAIGCLASQVVAGTNYCVACRVRPIAPEGAAPELRLMFVYAALDGSAEITSEITVDIAEMEKES